MMIFLKLLLISSGLMFIPETTSIRNESSLCYQPSKYIKPIHYDIKLISYIEGHIFYGEYNISISILNKTQQIFLQSEKLSIKDIVLFTNVKKYHEYDKDTVYKLTYNIQEDTIDILLMDELLPGNYILNIKYHGFADEVFRIYDVKGKIAWVAVIHFHIICPRRRLSCWDHQNLLLEATFNISIGCNQCTALSNMPLQNEEENKYKVLWTHFATTSAISPYLVRMIVSNFLFHIDYDNRNIEMWCSNEYEFHMKFAKKFAENITLLLKNEWNLRSKQILKVTHVAIPNFHDNGIIDLGLVFYKETDIIYDKKLYPISHKIEIAQLVGRKVIQELFNTLLNDPFVSDFWIKKGFSALFATYVVNMGYPDSRIGNLFIVQNQHYSFNLDGDYYMWNSALQVHNSLEIPDSIRAPFMLRMMEHLSIGGTLQKFMSLYHELSHHLSSADVKANFTAIINQYMRLELPTMKDWASEKHCPLIKVARDYDDYHMSQTRVWIQYSNTLEIRYIPITFTTETSLNFDNFTTIFLPVSQYLKLSIKKNDWVIFNIQQVGYYRVNYDNENWHKISHYLNFNDYTKIHVLNRAQIIDDAFHLMIADQLDCYTFWDLIVYLHQERDYVAWYPMFKAMEYMFGTFSWKEMGTSVTSIVRHALYLVLETIKYEEIDDTDELRICLRQEAARWACFLDSLTCKKKANDKLEQHLQDPKKHKLLPWWQEWTYCNGLRTTTNIETWRLVYGIGYGIEYDNEFDPKFIEYMACPEDVNMIKNYLKIKPIKKREIQYLLPSFLHIITKHAKNRTTLQYILNDFLDIKPKHVNIAAAFIIIINNVYSVNRTQEINRYVQRLKVNVNEIVGIKEKDFITQNTGKIESKISIRNHQIERQRQYLNRIFCWIK